MLRIHKKQLSTKKCESILIKLLIHPRGFIEYLNDFDNVYENIDK